MESSPELLSLVLSLRPLPAKQAADAAPIMWGRAAHTLFLNTIRLYDPPLAEALHAAPGNMENGESQNAIRPFTVSSLNGRLREKMPIPEGVYSLRFTAFRQDVAKLLLRAADSGVLSPERTIELDTWRFRIQQALTRPAGDLGPAEWAAEESYASLSSRLLLAKEDPARRIRLEFASPTSFKQSGKHMPVPLPELVFGSLLERWNAFAPVTFPPEARRYAAECLAISRYRLASRPVPMKGGGMRVGAVGQVTYTCLSYDRYWMSLVGVLAEFSLYAGVGVGTSMGMGQCHQLPAG